MKVMDSGLLELRRDDASQTYKSLLAEHIKNTEVRSTIHHSQHSTI